MADATVVSARTSALLILVHGSPNPSANDEMFRVVDLLRRRGTFAIVQAGFMECNNPTIPEAIVECIAGGAERIIAVPYFLHTGTHVAGDLPTAMETAQCMYPQIEFLMGPYLGNSEQLTDILADRIRAAV